MSDLLTPQEINAFIENGYIRVDNVFSKELANTVVDILWKDIPLDRDSPASWTQPVVRLGMYTEPAFIESVNSPHLYRIFDQLVGAGRWIPCRNVGSFPVRFPSVNEPSDTGWHVDASFPGENALNFLEWRVNIHSKGRALLMLILYSDVTELDAPTLIRKRSHIDVARLLAKKGQDGLSFMELASRVNQFPEAEIVEATGEAGSIYLCHPFIVHAAQAHRGLHPKFMAQPPLLLREPLQIYRPMVNLTPVETAIQLALDTK